MSKPFIIYGDAQQHGFTVTKANGLKVMKLTKSGGWVGGEMTSIVMEEINRHGGIDALIEILNRMKNGEEAQKAKEKTAAAIALKKNKGNTGKAAPTHKAVVALAEKHKIDISKVKGTGKNGTIKKVDVEALIK